MNVETMRLLVAKGLSAEDILEIAESMDAPRQRSAAAERQARYRARRKAEEEQADAVTDGVTDNVTRDGNERNAPPLSRPLSPQTPLTPTHTPGTQTPARVRADDFPCPDWCEPAVWRDLKANRRTKKLTNTPTAHKRFVEAIEAMADEHWPPGRLVEAIAAKGWGGPHDPRDDRKPNNDNRKQPSSGSNTAALARQKLGLG